MADSRVSTKHLHLCLLPGRSHWPSAPHGSYHNPAAARWAFAASAVTRRSFKLVANSATGDLLIARRGRWIRTSDRLTVG
jgi:hypothetical protein